jgi:ribonuclease HI
MKRATVTDYDFIIFTDGSSRGNPGPGGYGAIAIYTNGKGEVCVDELGGREDQTTNNRMELKAVIEGLKNFIGYYADLKDYTATVYLDSSYVQNGITKWVSGWKKNDWKTGTKKKEEVKNKDLWITLDQLVEDMRVTFVRIAGHAGIPGNERCDEIATQFADNKPITLYSGLLAEYPVEQAKDIFVIEVTTDALTQKAKVSARKSGNGTKAYSYVSLVHGQIHIDKDWKTCEARVKGKSGARFKKSVSPIDEQLIVDEFLNKN